MSTEEFNRKLEESRKLINMIKKDLRYREDQQKRGQTTYSLDAEIKGSFSQLDDVIARLEQIVMNFRANPRDFGLSNKEIQKRVQQYNQLSGEKANYQRTFDSFFEKKRESGLFDQNKSEKPDYTNMTSGQLYQNKKKQQENQDQMIEEIIGVVKVTKQGQKAVGKELQHQDGLLKEVDAGFDDNIKNMGKVRRNMVKLLDSSSNCCLISVIVLEIAAVICILLLWK